jgi:hypothetical protein
VGRDIIIKDHASHLQQINERHRKFMSMQYPLLFPCGEDGFHDNIMYRETQGSASICRQKATMVEYYAYRLHDRPEHFNTPLRCARCGRGTQAYAYCYVEREKIDHYRIKSFQEKHRSTTYSSPLSSCMEKNVINITQSPFIWRKSNNHLLCCKVQNNCSKFSFSNFNFIISKLHFLFNLLLHT